MTDEPAISQLCETHGLLRIAKWHLDEIARTMPATTSELAKRIADHADVVTVFAAATVEERLNSFIASPLLFMTEVGPRRFLAELVTEHLRLNTPDKLSFLRSRVPELEAHPLFPKVRKLCERRNRILHTSFEYEEVKSLPDQPYVASLHRHLPESAFVQRPSLVSRRQFDIPPEAQAEADHKTACEFLGLMFHARPYEPWPPPGFE